MSLIDRDEYLKNYLHPDNWMSSQEAEHIVRMEALEEEELEWQKELNGDYDSD